MKKQHLKSTIMLFIIAIAAALALTLLIHHNTPMRSVSLPVPTRFTFNNITYKFTGVQITLEQQEEGLMNASVTNSTFMLFDFNSTSIYPFWMKNTYYPLDIIWVNQTSVVYIADAIPCSSYSTNQTACIVYNGYSGGQYANYVIETQAGFVNRTGIKVGSTIKMN